MPYFVFRLQPFTVPEPLAEFAVFAEASARAKALRVEQAPPARIRVVFADNAQAAEDLLLQPRERAPAGDDE